MTRPTLRSTQHPANDSIAAGGPASDRTPADVVSGPRSCPPARPSGRRRCPA